MSIKHLHFKTKVDCALQLKVGVDETADAWDFLPWFSNQVMSHYHIRSYLTIWMLTAICNSVLWIEGYCNEKYNDHLLQSIRNHQSLHHWWLSIARVKWSCRLTMSLKTPPFQIQSWLFLPAQGWSLWNCCCWRFSVLTQDKHSLPTPWLWFPELA